MTEREKERLEKAIRVFTEKYADAISRKDYIVNPIAWALYQTWRIFDLTEKRDMDENSL